MGLNWKSVQTVHVTQACETLWKETLWYYRSLADAFQKFLPGQLASELDEIVRVLETS
jgi:hypothetical protein